MTRRVRSLTAETATEWDKTKWGKAPRLPLFRDKSGHEVCPYVGVRLPNFIHTKAQFEKWFKRSWYSKAEVDSWDLLPFKRDEWFYEILDNWEMYLRRIRYDMTPRFKKQIRKLLKKGGFIMVIGGTPAAQGDGKSIGGLMVLDLLQREFGIDVTPHVLFEHAHMQITVDDSVEEWTVLDIDEDLRATGNDSGTLIIEISNTWKTNRKGKLIVISVGIDPGRNHPAVNIHLIPCGINEKFQATRFACYSGGRFVGWAVMQRLYTPDDEVRYGPSAELAPLAEYEARAVDHSRRVVRTGLSAVPREIKEADIELVMDWLEMEKQQTKAAGQDWRPPALNVIITESELFGLRTKSSGYATRICATALYRFGKANPELTKQVTESVDLKEILNSPWVEFWEDYHKIIFHNYPDSYLLADRDAWMVTYRQMGFKDREIKDLLKLNIRVNSIGERIRKGVSEWNVLPTNTQLGTIGEKFLGSRIDSPVTPCSYPKDSLTEPTGRDVPDLSDTGNTRTATWALNVKVSFETDFDRTFETSPEHETTNSYTVFLFPTLGKAALCELRGEVTRYNSKAMVLCGIEELENKIREALRL